METINFIYENEQQLLSYLQSLPKKETLIQIFSGVINKEKIKNLLNIIKKNSDAKVIGATTDGEIINENVTQNKIIVSISLFDKTKVNTYFLPKTKRSYEMGIELGEKIGDSKVAIIFADGFNINGEDFLKGIKTKTKALISGGLAGDNAQFKVSYVFDSENITDEGVVCAVLRGDIKAYNSFAFNWHSIGKKMKVTKSFKNIVYEIDNKPAADVYKHYFGELAEDIVRVGIEFPLIVKRNQIEVARAIVKKNDDGSLVFAGNINEGEVVRFGFGEVDSILKEDKKLFKDFSKHSIESIFIYSCMARKRFLGENIKLEILPFSKIAPISGFFTYGEFYNELFFNETMTVLALSENGRRKKINCEECEEEEDRLFTIKALSHLIKTTSEELNELNENLESKVMEKTKEIVEKNKKLEYLITHDNLTGVYNKFEFDNDIPKIKSIMLIDIKDFSKINDLYGEIIGDEVLKSFARFLRKITGDKIYRFNADQFIIASFEERNLKELYQKIYNFLKNNPIKIEYENSEIEFDLNIKVAVVNKKYENIKLKADLLLKYMKDNHYDYLEYSEDLKLEEKLRKEIEIINMVKKAIVEDRIIPVFQKVVKKDDYYYEALVRIKEGNKLISPFVFLNIIKLTDYYFDLTKVMIEKVFKIFSKREEKVSINLAYSDVRNENLVEYIKSKIKEYSMEGRVIFEILEDENIENFEILKNFIKEVKGFDVGIAIDDFGSGYSNFFYLTEMKPDIIKIDGSLIKNIDKNRDLYIISKYINAFAKEIGCNTVAEYVKDENVYKKVIEIGVDGVQGYFIEKPKVIE